MTMHIEDPFLCPVCNGKGWTALGRQCQCPAGEHAVEDLNKQREMFWQALDRLVSGKPTPPPKDPEDSL